MSFLILKNSFYFGVHACVCHYGTLERVETRLPPPPSTVQVLGIKVRSSGLVRLGSNFSTS